jgi:hypothetical protein
MGTMHYSDAIVHVMDCPFDPQTDRIDSMTDEPVSWHSFEDGLHAPRLIPNLRVVIPLVRCGVKGWRLHGVPGIETLLSLDLEGCRVA